MVTKITSMAPPMKKGCSEGCDVALENAIISNLEMVTLDEKERLGVITKRLFER